jgi:hypothetical protein
MKNFIRTLLIGAAIVLPGATAAIVATNTLAQTAPASAGLRAGVARVDITPAVADLPAAFKTIHDPLFVRALVLDNGATRAVVVVGDLPTIAPAELKDLTHRIAVLASAPESNVMVAVTHNHSAVRIDHTVAGILLPGSPQITDKTVAATLEAVKQAMGKLVPAQAGYAEGKTVLIGRRPSQSGAPEESGAAAPDATLGVFKVATLTGEPIAFLINSGLEPVVVQPLSGWISADVAGATERYLEQRYGDKPVAMYTVGSISTALYSARRPGHPPGDPGTLMTAMGTILGEDVLNTAMQIKMSPTLSISGAQSSMQCPGKVTTPLNTPAQCSDAPGSKLPACKFTDTDSPPVKLQYGALKLGNLTIAQSDANITQPVWQRLKSQSPANTALVAQVYGPMKYVVDDAAYASNSYVATATTAKRGCAAQGFVDNTLKLITSAK